MSPLGLVDLGSNQWGIEETDAPDGHIVKLPHNQYAIDPDASGGAEITESGGSYFFNPEGLAIMAVTSEVVTVSTTAVALNEAQTFGQWMLLKNTSANAADLGASTVEAAAGFGLAAGATVSVFLKAGDILYAIRSAGSDATIAVLRT
jgi:hypothetical protein